MMSATKDATLDQMVEALKPTLEERVARVRAIQKRTVHRNGRLRDGLWNAEEDETLDVNVLLPVEQA